MGSTIRRIGNRILVRNTFTYNPDMSTSEKQIRRIGAAHDRSFQARFPMLGEIPMEFRWEATCVSPQFSARIRRN